nr:VENN motif pre-toxin domain-containing protein [Acinetobacter gerneri]
MTPTEQDAYFSQNSTYAAALANEKVVTGKWGIGGDSSRVLNAVTTIITGALGGQTDLQVATNTLAPYASQLIGSTVGHGENENTAAQLVSHAILGAVLAYVNGGDPAAGGSAAVASEAAAKYIANQYNDGKTAINPETGKFDPNLLPESTKASIRDLTSAIGAAVGGTVGDSTFNAQLAGVVGKNAVENNVLESVRKDKTTYYDDIDIKFNILQYAVANGLIARESVPESIFEELTDTTNYKSSDGTTILSPEANTFSNDFDKQIKDGDVISQSEYEQLVKDNPKLIAELQLSLVNQSIVNESRELWDTIKGPVFKYVVPGLQLTGGVAQLGLAAGIDVAGCATVVGCGIAVVGSSYFIVNGSDDIATAIANFGKEPLKQTNSFVLTNNGVDEETAGNIKLVSGIVNLFGEAVIVNQGLKATTSTVGNVANKSSDLMDSSTAAGDTVRHNSVSTAIGDDSATINNFKNATDTGNGHNIIVHGSKPNYDEIGGITVINDKPTNVEQVAEAVRNNPDYVAGTPICFGSCWSGSSGTAQELANSLKTPVYAPVIPPKNNRI